MREYSVLLVFLVVHSLAILSRIGVVRARLSSGGCRRADAYDIVALRAVRASGWG
jgi:hypothetical protein